MQSEAKRSVELEEVHNKLDITTLDLRKTEALSRVIGETLRDTIVTCDERGYILSVNPAVTEMFGYQTEELLGQSITNLLLSIKQDGGESTAFYHCFLC
ncbi:hypothetical protein GCM10020331_051560 [Ectobacillus funiculus]